MRIADIRAVPISFPVPAEKSVRLGIGRSVKRDAVLVRVETDEGQVGWGEAHHGRCPGAVAKLVDTTLRELVLGFDAHDVAGVWARVYKMQLASHGMGAGAAQALSGLDMALWDLRSQATGWPLYRLLGGSSKPIKAYAGGISLGWQEPSNTAYTVDDVRKVMPAFEEAAVGWLEEPFPPQDRRAYATAAALGRVPLAAGENHYTRYEFATLLEDAHVQFVQPDLSKTGGVTEAMRIAAMASAYKLTVNPHTSATAINMATTIHFLCAVDNPGYFEGDVTSLNPFRDQLADKGAYALDKDGCVRPYEGVGIGLKIDTRFIAEHPLIEGPCYV